MKSFLVIGMGRFGQKLATDLSQRGNDVMIVDRDDAIINELSPRFTSAYIGDCANEDVLRALGVRNFDAVIVAMGDDFQSSLEITALAKELGCPYVVAKADRDVQAKFLLRNGADEVVYPDRDTASRLAMKLHSSSIFDYIELSDEYAIYEISVPRAWVGRSLQENDIRRRYGLNIMAIRDGDTINPLPNPDYVFEEGDHVFVISRAETIEALSD